MKAKRIISCFLLILMAMNTIGYYSLLVMVRDQVSNASVKKIQSNLNEPGADLIVKIPLTVPYQSDSEYMPTSGLFTHEGKVYQTVKQRLYRDTLYLVCIHDQRTTEADLAINDFAKSFAGDEDNQGNAVRLVSFFAKYYFPVSHELQQAQAGWVMERMHGEYITRKERDNHVAIFQPPRSVS